MHEITLVNGTLSTPTAYHSGAISMKRTIFRLLFLIFTVALPIWSVRGADSQTTSSAVYIPSPSRLVLWPLGEADATDATGSHDNIVGAGADLAASNVIYLPLLTEPLIGLVNGDFEAGPAGWGQFSENGWQLIVSATDLPLSPHSGSWAAWLGGDNDEVAAIWQVVTIPADYPFLQFWYWIASSDVCGYDVGGVGINLDVVADAFWLCAASNTGGWTRRVVDLSDFAGQTVEIDIVVGTDDTFKSSLFVDDTVIGAGGRNAPPQEEPSPSPLADSPMKALWLDPPDGPSAPSGIEPGRNYETLLPQLQAELATNRDR